MICLDTNYLIGALIPGSQEARNIVGWSRQGEILVTPALAWYEFLCGPVTPAQVSAIRAFLQDIVSFEEPQAGEAARLFNGVGRKRSLRVDAAIAASAIVAGASLATNNLGDFRVFVPLGLRLV